MPVTRRSIAALSVLALAVLIGPRSPRASAGEITFDASDVPIVLPASQIDAPAYWLRKASNEILEQIKAKAPQNDPSQPGTLDALLPLVTVGEIRVGDADGARQALRMLESRARAISQPAMRSLAYLQLADFHQQMCDQTAYTAALADAQKAAGANRDPFFKPMIDLRLATLLDQAGQQLAADDVAWQTSDMIQKASVYCTLAIVSNRNGNIYDCSRRLDRARAASEGEDDDTASNILCRVAKTYAQLNQFDAARITADSIPIASARADAYGMLALRQMKANDARGYRDAILKARAALATLAPKDATWQYDLLAYQQGESNDAEGQRQTLELSRAAADRLADPAAKSKAMFDLADVYGFSGNVTACLGAVSEAEKAAASSTTDDGMLGVISSARAHAAAAQRARGEIPGVRYCDLACTLARAGRLDEAQRMIDRIPTGVDRSPATAALAEARAGENDLDGATDLLRQLSAQPALQARICRRIGEAYSSRGQFEDLSRWLLTLASPTERSYACLGAADGMLDRRLTEFSAADLTQVINP